MIPIVILSFLGIVVLFLGFLKSKNVLLPASLMVLAIALVGNFVEWGQGTLLYFNGMFAVNNLTLAFNAVVLVSAFMIFAMTRGFQDDDEAQPAEYYAIMIFSLVGALMIIGFENLMMLFLGVEILSIAMYVLTGSDKRNLRSNEAALKYFLMGAFSAGIMLFGIALLYGATGSFSLSGINNYITASQGQISYLLYAGLMLLLIGMLFKVSAAPFHFWTPDVYEGAPSIFTAFMATIVKTAGFAALFRLLSHSFAQIYDFWWITLVVITVLTLLVGNLVAVYQNSFKRMLAYSSISHAGYMLIALTSLTSRTENSILFYSMAYSVATICAFGVLIPLSREKAMNGEARETYEAFNGLARNNPLLAFVLTVSMLSLAGIPLTAGFWGKFLVFGSAAERGLIWLLVVAVLMSAVGIYYYFRVVIAAYMKEGTTAHIRVAPFYQIVLISATIITILFGIAPGLFSGLV